MGTKLPDSMSAKAHQGKPDTATKITDIYTEIYDNQWADAMEGLSSFSEKEAIKILLVTLMKCHKICREVALSHLDYLQSILRTPCVSRPTLPTQPQPTYDKRNSGTTNKLLNKCQHLAASDAVEDIMKKRIDGNPNIDKNVDREFIKKCLEVCWFMNVQDPPMALGTEAKFLDKFDFEQYREYTISGTVVDYTVWPPLLLYINGPILSKGVAQPVKRSILGAYAPSYPKHPLATPGKSHKKDEQEDDIRDKDFIATKAEEQRAKPLRPDRTDRIRRTRSARCNDFGGYIPKSRKKLMSEEYSTPKLWFDDENLQDSLQKKDQDIESLQQKLKQQEEFSNSRQILSDKLERLNDMNEVLRHENAKIELELQKKQSELNKAKEQIYDPIKMKNETTERIRIDYEDLYQNYWGTALTDSSLYRNKSAVRILLDILKECYLFCEKTISAQAESLQQILKPPSDEADGADTWSPWTVKKQSALKNCKKLIAEVVTDHSHITEKFIEENQGKLQQVKTVFVKKCFKICWLMNLQDPPVVIAKEAIQGEEFDKTKYKTYNNLSTHGCVVEYTVWPPLFQGELLICAGVAKPINLGKSLQVPVTKN